MVDCDRHDAPPAVALARLLLKSDDLLGRGLGRRRRVGGGGRGQTRNGGVACARCAHWAATCKARGGGGGGALLLEGEHGGRLDNHVRWVGVEVVSIELVQLAALLLMRDLRFAEIREDGTQRGVSTGRARGESAVCGRGCGRGRSGVGHAHRRADLRLVEVHARDGTVHRAREQSAPIRSPRQVEHILLKNLPNNEQRPRQRGEPDRERAVLPAEGDAAVHPPCTRLAAARRRAGAVGGGRRGTPTKRPWVEARADDRVGVTDEIARLNPRCARCGAAQRDRDVHRLLEGVRAAQVLPVRCPP